MIIGCILIVCVTLLAAQHAQHEHERTLKTDLTALQTLTARVEALETRQAGQFDPKAFEELKSTVDTLRIAQGLRGSR